MKLNRTVTTILTAAATIGFSCTTVQAKPENKTPWVNINGKQAKPENKTPWVDINGKFGIISDKPNATLACEGIAELNSGPLPGWRTKIWFYSLNCMDLSGRLFVGQVRVKNGQSELRGITLK
jgi:hypothetical protein